MNIFARILRRKWLLFTILLWGIVITSIYIGALPDKFETEVLLTVEWDTDKISSTQFNNSLRNQRRYIQSHSFLLKVVERNRRIANNVYKTEDTDLVARKVKEDANIYLSFLNDKNLLQVKIIAKNALLAELLANGIANLYIKEDVANAYISGGRIVYEEQLDPVLRDYIETGRIDKAIIDTYPLITESPEILALKVKLDTKKLKLRELRRYYKTGYPELIKLRQEIANLNAEIYSKATDIMEKAKDRIMGRVFNVKVLEWAGRPRLPFWPNRQKMSLIATIMVFLMAIFAVLAIDIRME